MTGPAEEPGLILRIAARGDGVTADGRHVALSAPGDRLAADGSLIAGPHHVEPPCRHFPQCGGCQLQQLSDAAYADYVRDRVAGALTGQGLSDAAVVAPHVSPARARRRASLRALRIGRRIVIGFTEGGSHRVIDMAECWLLHPALFALVAPLRTLLSRPGMIDKSAGIVMTLTDGGIDLMLDNVRTDGLATAEAITAFASDHGLARLTIAGAEGDMMTLWEPEPVTITFGGQPVRTPAGAFLQATSDGEAVLAAEVVDAAGDAAMVADLFAGLGTFALALALAGGVPGRKLYAAEGARDLVLALKQAGDRLPGHIFAEHRDLFRRPLVPVELNRFGAVVIDPPRAGARDQVAQLACSTVPRIAYVSCNPSSFARDALLLKAAGYSLGRVRPVGQFRWSTHVELVATFIRR